jgi:hypothetical protein
MTPPGPPQNLGSGTWRSGTVHKFRRGWARSTAVDDAEFGHPGLVRYDQSVKE